MKVFFAKLRAQAGLSPHHWQLANESSDTAFGMSGFTVSQLIDGDTSPAETVKNLNIEHFLADYVHQ